MMRSRTPAADPVLFFDFCLTSGPLMP